MALIYCYLEKGNVKVLKFYTNISSYFKLQNKRLRFFFFFFFLYVRNKSHLQNLKISLSS